MTRPQMVQAEADGRRRRVLPEEKPRSLFDCEAIEAEIDRVAVIRADGDRACNRGSILLAVSFPLRRAMSSRALFFRPCPRASPMPETYRAPDDNAISRKHRALTNCVRGFGSA
jgi:hypothetical protein